MLSLGALVAATGSCGGDATGPAHSRSPGASYVRLVSDPGDIIGQGKTYEYDLTNAEFVVGAYQSSVGASGLDVLVYGDEWWRGGFYLSTGTKLQVGTYTNVIQGPDVGPGQSSLTWFNEEGPGCNTRTGLITVDSVVYSGDELTEIDLRFEQHCNGAAAALRGTIHWRASDPTPLPGPVFQIPSNLWRPSASLLPAAGNYLVLVSDAGDPVGLGRTWSFVAPTEVTAASFSFGYIVIFPGSDPFGGFRGVLASMKTAIPTQAGYYPSVTKFPTKNPTRAGLNWSKGGEECNTVTGWFAIDKIAVDSQRQLTALDLRFEQHCDGKAALHGAVHWTQ